ncbi:glycosyltransferase [Mycoplasmopsis fermentans]|uniref:glycosyltransferase n=1 Tax=Mycoplasmopsis fermentans TaxID=2115 RepID=UPI0001E32E74|nr:glycosyltransferase [Mycoplasmopsis fermentans]ADN69038.1 putative glycosyltransferase [Mycoplasmopsis fermentans JER]RMX35253.1 glycosyl transferase 2 family protein [Mycoplasmopsis fermentans MF-I2]
MKLSIISPGINSAKSLKNILEGMKDQNNQDFELILALRNPSAKMYSIIEKYLAFFGTRLKFITNNRQRTIQSDIVCAFHLVKGSYATIINSDNSMRSYFAQELTNYIEKFNPDVLEYRPRLVGTVKWKPNPRLEEEKLYNIQENHQVLAYTYPFIFNKVFKKSLINQFLKHRSIVVNDSKFCIELNYFMLLKAQSYLYTNKRIVREFIPSSLWLNPKTFIEQFKAIENYVKTNNLKFEQEIAYARMYFLQIFLGALLNTWRLRFWSKDVIKDRINYNEKRADRFVNELYKYLEKEHLDNSLFFNTNIYVIKNNFEANFLKTLPKVKKWEDILDNL